MSSAPVVYIFHGDDDVAIAEAVAGLQAKLGDATTADMNTSRLDGTAASIDELVAATHAAPFLAERRLVVLTNPKKLGSSADVRQQLSKVLGEIPASTALVLHESAELAKNSWFLKWANEAGERAFVRLFALPTGGQMRTWIEKKSGELGGEIESQAAATLANLVGSDTRSALNEIEKLLAYVNYQRPVDLADVQALSVQIGDQGDFFALIDAIGAGASAKAISALQDLLAERDSISLFFGLVGHFRVLLQAREVVEGGGDDAVIAKRLNIHPFRAKKLAGQARRFDLHTLEAIYQRLLEDDLKIKTGLLAPDLALDAFIATLSVGARAQAVAPASTSSSTPIQK